MESLSDKMRELNALKERPRHTLRGVLPARKWSKYQETDSNWTLCGIHRDHPERTEVTEVIGEVTCLFCLDLLK